MLTAGQPPRRWPLPIVDPGPDHGGRDRATRDELQAATPDVSVDDLLGRTNPTKRSVMVAVLRRLWPCLLEATLIPTALCYAGLLIHGLGLGIAAASIWTYLAVGRRIASGRPVPGLLVLATLGLSVRLTLYILNDNAFVYFLQPIARSSATAVLFALSAMLGRPLIARFAGDFCSFTSDVEARPAIEALFRRLTYLWASAQAALAVINMTLLLTVPVTVFIGTAAASAWVIMGVCTTLTVADSVRTTREDGLRTMIAHGGRLHAYIAAPA